MGKCTLTEDRRGNSTCNGFDKNYLFWVQNEITPIKQTDWKKMKKREEKCNKEDN